MAKKKLLRELTPLVMAVVFMVMYLAVYSHVIIFHEQHHLFVFSWRYAAATIHEYGLWRWLTEFIIQFSYWPWLGALVWTVVLMGAYCMGRGAIRRLTGLDDRLQLSCIAPCVMFFSTVNVDVIPELAVKIFAGVAAVWVVSLIAGRFIPKKWHSDRNSRAATVWALCGPLIFGGVFAFCSRDFYKPRTITLPSGKTREMTREEMHNQRYFEKLMMKADQAVRRSDWDEVIALTDEQALSGHPNHLMAYFRSMALYHKGRLFDDLFDQPQRFGVRALYYPWKADRNQAEYGGYVYEQLGALNSAIHWEFESIVGWGETAQHLINLSRYYIETSKPAQARKFIAPLRKTLFYRSEARRLEQMLAEGHVEGLRDALRDAPQTPGRWDAVRSLPDDLAYILINDPTNTMARDYLLCALLLENRLGAFYSVLCDTWDRAEPLPRMLQQALCMVRVNYGGERLAADGWQISPEVDAEFREYLQTQARGRAARFSPAQKQTPWFYVHFISPAGRELIF